MPRRLEPIHLQRLADRHPVARDVRLRGTGGVLRLRVRAGGARRGLHQLPERPRPGIRGWRRGHCEVHAGLRERVRHERRPVFAQAQSERAGTHRNV